MGEVRHFGISTRLDRFCSKCGTLCIGNISEEDISKLNNNKTVKVISNEEAYESESRTNKKFLKHGDSAYTCMLMTYHITELLNHKFHHLDNGTVCDEFTLCEQFHDSILNRIAWYDENIENTVYCPVCGNETRSHSFTVTEIRDFIQDTKKHLGRPLTKQEEIDLRRSRHNSSIKLKSNPISANKEYEKRFDSLHCRQEVDTYLEDCGNNLLGAQLNTADKSKINVAEYIDHLINMETCIRYNSELLYNLLLNQRKTGRLACYEKYGTLKKIELDLKRNAEEQSQLSERFKFDDTKPTEAYFNLIKPKKENIEKQVINPPEYKKPNLFNKSKVLAENERIKQNYLLQVDKANEEYEKAVQASNNKYEAELAEYNKKLAQMQEEYYTQQKEKNDKLQAQKVEEERRLLEEQKYLESEKNKFADDIDNQLLSSTNQQIDNMLLQEIAEVKETLRKLYDTKHQLESLEIVYPKYLDFIALTTISEYLATGRCTVLTGADGAYNLYESEIRADRIIAQLDQVIDSLEQIKENQYKTYSLLKEVGDNISDISKKMDSAVTALSNIQDHTKRIEENSAMIAYNTAKTAHYMKINNQLTNAIGFLIALK